MDNKYIRQFKKGALELVLLGLLQENEAYGYQLICQLDRRGGAIFGGAREGTIYPVLYRLEEAGLIRSRLAAEGGRERKYYALTDQGQTALGELKAFWQDFTHCVNGFLEEERQ